ncbi:hypothetical protein [Helicobacter felis]|uniref:hypothetical protein n=1 Tax=Helicobacter felis TaxID=214 RepID=UPI00131591F7|nr:hypothetical protein [Helicobacter felis]
MDTLSPCAQEEGTEHPLQKALQSLPSSETYPCVDYQDETYLCGGKRLVRERHGTH